MTGRKARPVSPTMALAMWLLWLPNDGQIWRLFAYNYRRLWRDAATPTAATYEALHMRGLTEYDRCLTDAGLDWIVAEIEQAWDRAHSRDVLRDELIADGLANGYIVRTTRIGAAT